MGTELRYGHEVKSAYYWEIEDGERERIAAFLTDSPAGPITITYGGDITRPELVITSPDQSRMVTISLLAKRFDD